MASQADLYAGIRARLDVAIKARNLTPQEVSIKAGFPPAYVGNMLRRGFGPSTSRFLTLCGVLKVSGDWLVSGAGPMFNDDWFRGVIASKILDAVEADVAGLEPIAAYVREQLAPYEVTDNEILAAGRMMVAVWQEKPDGLGGDHAG